MIIKGNKVVLIPIKPKEKNDFYKMATRSYGSDFWYGKIEKKKLTKKKFFEDVDDGYFDLKKKYHGQCFWIVKDGEKIGEINYNHIDRHHKNTELDIIIGQKKHIGQGYGTDALKALIGYLFDKFKLHRIWLGTRANNPRAIKVYKKIGFIEEGRMRESENFNKKYVDCVIMGILEREYINGK